MTFPVLTKICSCMYRKSIWQTACLSPFGRHLSASSAAPEPRTNDLRPSAQVDQFIPRRPHQPKQLVPTRSKSYRTRLVPTTCSVVCAPRRKASTGLCVPAPHARLRAWPARTAPGCRIASGKLGGLHCAELCSGLAAFPRLAPIATSHAATTCPGRVCASLC